MQIAANDMCSHVTADCSSSSFCQVEGCLMQCGMLMQEFAFNRPPPSQPVIGRRRARKLGVASAQLQADAQSAEQLAAPTAECLTPLCQICSLPLDPTELPQTLREPGEVSSASLQAMRSGGDPREEAGTPREADGSSQENLADAEHNAIAEETLPAGKHAQVMLHF